MAHASRSVEGSTAGREVGTWVRKTQRATSMNRETVRALPSGKQNQTFSQIRTYMSASFCTASTALPLGRRLRRRLGRAVVASDSHG